MTTPWKLQQIEPGVWAIMDADGETILTLGQWEYAEGQMVVEVVNGMVEALDEIVEAYGSENLIGGDFRKYVRNTAREALDKVRGEGADDG